MGNSVQTLLAKINGISQQLLSSFAQIPVQDNVVPPKIHSVSNMSAFQHNTKQTSSQQPDTKQTSSQQPGNDKNIDKRINTALPDANNENNTDNIDNDIDALMLLTEKRQNLIKQLFSTYKANEISLVTEDLQQMIDLDNLLSLQAIDIKQSLRQQVLALKNSKRINKSYQKY